MYLNIGIKQLRKKLLNEKFVIRIRENKGDIVYYNGIKVFVLNENKEKTEVTVPENLYRFSFNDVKEILESRQIDEELEERISLLSKFKEQKYFDFNMNSISFEKADDYIHNEVENRFNDFCNHLKRMDKIEEYLDEINIKVLLQELEENEKYTLKFKKPVDDIKLIVYIQFYFIKCLKINQEDNSEFTKTIRKISFGNLIYSYKEVIEYDKLESLIKIIQEVVNNARVKEFEKRYQFMFMLYASKMASNLFSECYYPFEQEYGFRNELYHYKGLNGKNCRIDCVFFKYNGIKITDLYLIELKVDDSVVSGNNGVLTHLDDIDSLFYKDGKSNIKFFRDIKKQIKYRMKELGYFVLNDDQENEEVIDFDVHFFTVFGYTKEESKENIKYVLECIKTKEGVERLCDNTAGKLKLTPYFKVKNLSLQTYIDHKERYNETHQYKYDFKFFFDKDTFDIDSWNKNIYRDNLKLIYCDLNKNIEEIDW